MRVLKVFVIWSYTKFGFWSEAICDPKASFEHNIEYPCPNFAICKNISAFIPVIHVKNIFKVIAICNLHKHGLLPLNLNQSEPPFPRDASYQIWLKSI